MITSQINSLEVFREKKIIEALKIIEQSLEKIVLVVDEKGILIGTVTDGDVRRGFITGKTINDTVEAIMNPHPTVFNVNESRELIDQVMISKKLLQIPLINDAGKVIDLVLSEQLLVLEEKANTVVLMAGGLGSRLGDLTSDCPKPMLKVGDKPILHGVIDHLKAHRFKNFVISVNYKAEVIQDYFKDGRDLEVNITYIKEKQKMGTAGSLSLLDKDVDEPILVMNGDVLTKVDFTQFLKEHMRAGNLASMCVYKYESQIPFGVVHVNDDKIITIEEKPVYDHLISAGIYALAPKVLDLIPKESYFDMPSLFRKIIEKHPNSAGVFPIHEYWIDVGRKDDLSRAQNDYRSRGE